ncbi:LacI family DNA-binding transcriptional regulator [Streptomyces radicis]|uniref:LacI family transcriptional regulator n=1 Tax=Streptomyces radicis TaxID=1750517 RepID=A0A3A9W2E3_9ACTN|nr:LacI family DNA-binding transcriptional regulator [Streptomyces radicis]RKN07009.1 LacI family transcriptional regulator [Streptomyces radicis]RKN15851.1 LacI family transcriptional regulator [Streptomyces radicis]
MVTSRDVAALAGVSQSTVSYVMSGSRSISRKTRARVEEAMRQLGYQPNASARALAGRRTHVLGLVVHVSARTELAGVLPFIETITAAAREREYDIVLVTADEGRAGLERLARRGIVDAFIVMDVTREDERIDTLTTLALPTVLIGRPDDSRGLHCVDVDGWRAGELAVEELIAAGTGKVIVIGEPADVPDDRYRFIADFEAGACHQAEHADVSAEVVHPPEPGWPGILATRDLLLSAHERTGILARTPIAAERVVQLLLEAGIAPAHDVPVVAMCEDDVAQELRIPVTNVSADSRQVARRAVDALFVQLRGGTDLPGLQLVAPTLTRRATTMTSQDRGRAGLDATEASRHT